MLPIALTASAAATSFERPLLAPKFQPDIRNLLNSLNWLYRTGSGVTL
jgi:hypothetical protein